VIPRDLREVGAKTYGDRRFRIKFVVQRGTARRDVTLQAEGLSDVLKSAGHIVHTGTDIEVATAD
jgi:hypothetical protein